jgi:hypothetical protein
MYFERNAYDPSVVSEAQTRLQSFQGATSISSNAYFGRDEEDDLGGERRSNEGLLGDSSLAGLEVAAKDAISRVMSNPDVQNAAESIRSGALKVDHLFSSPLRSTDGNYRFCSCRTTLFKCLNGIEGVGDLHFWDSIYTLRLVSCRILSSSPCSFFFLDLWAVTSTSCFPTLSYNILAESRRIYVV